MKKYAYLISVVFLFYGCQVVPEKKVISSEPKWMLDPYVDDDKIASIGCAGEHFKGKSAQKQLAISRALDAIAKQNKVIVNNITINSKKYSGSNQIESSSNSYTTQKVDNVKISTKVKAVYNNPNGDICVWVVQR